MTRLIELLRELSVKTGDFTLKSGKKSDLYVDVRQTALHCEGVYHIAVAVQDALDPTVEALGGVELGAVPIVGAVNCLGHTRWDGGYRFRDIHGFIVRKAAKEHGTKSKIERCPPKGTKVCIIEDVTTTGGSLEKAIIAAQMAGLDVVQVITVVDRQETFEVEGTAYKGAEEFLRAGGYRGVFTALTTREDLVG